MHIACRIRIHGKRRCSKLTLVCLLSISRELKLDFDSNNESRVLAAYAKTLTQWALSGPTVFAQVIQAASAQCARRMSHE